jgi:hypothetical protein
MDGLASPDPARQADVFYEVEREYTRAPTTASTLRYAVARVTPGHPASNPQEGKRLLETLLATPERMTQEERVFAASVAARDEHALEARRLRIVGCWRHSTTAAGRRQTRTSGCKRNLRKTRVCVASSAEAQQKLDAIKEIERSIIERSPTPPGSRDANPSETQSSSTSR